MAITPTPLGSELHFALARHTQNERIRIKREGTYEKRFYRLWSSDSDCVGCAHVHFFVDRESFGNSIKLTGLSLAIRSAHESSKMGENRDIRSIHSDGGRVRNGHF